MKKEPAKKMEHRMDAGRYALTTLLKQADVTGAFAKEGLITKEKLKMLIDFTPEDIESLKRVVRHTRDECIKQRDSHANDPQLQDAFQVSVEAYNKLLKKLEA